jgi:hypothetical protein
MNKRLEASGNGWAVLNGEQKAGTKNTVSSFNDSAALWAINKWPK